MKKRYMYCVLALILSAAVWAGSATLPVSAIAEKDVNSAIEGIIAWKKSDVGSSASEFLINDKFLEQAGTTAGDWYPIGLGRLKIADNQAGYLAVINDNISKRYSLPAKLDKAKATEWHRISLSVLASGGNPRRAGDDGNIDLIADGTYNRVENGAGILGKQGINGFIWGLIALDSLCYEVPEGAYYTRDDVILNILNRQLPDGGWALTGNVSDPDITAMAVQALAPYYNSEKEYSYRNLNSDAASAKKVREAVDEALDCLSEAQLPDGDFKSWGTENSESCSQVIIALCSLGIDFFNDDRFITEQGKTVLDGLFKYRNADGGFTHSFSYDAENPSADPEKSNTMAGEQALLALAAVSRASNGQRRLYDFRPEQSGDLKAKIKEAEYLIENLSFSSSNENINEAYDFYLGIEGSERSYVKNYKKLSSILAFAGIPYAEEKIEYNSGDAGVITPIEEFTAADRAAADGLPENLTTANRAEVLRLWSKIRNCFDFEGKERYFVKLDKAKNEIEAIQREIEDIKTEIKTKLYPFEKISLSDRRAVHDLYERFAALSEYDRAQLEQSDIEGLLKCKTQVDNLYLAVWISAACAVAAAGGAIFVVLHVRKRKKLKAAKFMAESEE